MANPISIDIWSDIACPWCYIGKRRLETALSRLAETPEAPEVQVRWHSFQLNPDAPVDFDGGQTDYLARHLGASPDQARQMQAQVTGIAAREGLDYHMDDVKITNTAKAHELIHFAESHGKGAEMKERLLRAYFTEGRHLGQPAELAALAAEIGLDAAAAEAALASGEFAAAVAEDKAQAAAYGIGGVPFFVIGGKYGLSGAQEPDLFLQALQKVGAEQAEVDRSTGR